MASESTDVADDLSPEQLERLEGFERELGEAFTDLGETVGGDEALIERLADGAMPSLPGATTGGGATGATSKIVAAVGVGALVIGVGAWLATRSPDSPPPTQEPMVAAEEEPAAAPIPDEPVDTAPRPKPLPAGPPAPAESESDEQADDAQSETRVAKPETRRKAAPKPSKDAAPKLSASELLKLANTARRNGDHTKAKEGYERLSREYPRSREDLIGRVSLGKLELNKLGDAKAALKNFDAYLDARPDGNLAEEALHGRAQALRRLGRGADERATWTELLRRFPDSVHATKAQQRLGKGSD